MLIVNISSKEITMEVDKLVVAIISVCGIVFTYWFFLMKKEDKAIEVEGDLVEIRVDGGYDPGSIVIHKGKKVTLSFLRKDPSSCLEEVLIPEFKIRKFLPLNQSTPISFVPKMTGTFELSCGMNMFHGKIIVK